MGAPRKSVKTYTRIYGVDFEGGNDSAWRIRVSGELHSVPKSVVSSYDVNAKEIVVELWWAKLRGLA